MVNVIGEDFIRKQNYVKLFKTNIQLNDQQIDQFAVDPRIQYFLKCKVNLNLALPILEKVINKTLALQNYTLSEGHCIGFAEACSLLDDQKVNRVLLNNNGIDGR